MLYADNFGSRNLFMVDPGVQYWDTGTNKTVVAPSSAWAAGLFAWTDATFALVKVYWSIRFTDVPPAENPNFLFEVTDQWMTEVLEAA